MLGKLYRSCHLESPPPPPPQKKNHQLHEWRSWILRACLYEIGQMYITGNILPSTSVLRTHPCAARQLHILSSKLQSGLAGEWNKKSLLLPSGEGNGHWIYTNNGNVALWLELPTNDRSLIVSDLPKLEWRNNLFLVFVPTFCKLTLFFNFFTNSIHYR